MQEGMECFEINFINFPLFMRKGKYEPVYSYQENKSSRIKDYSNMSRSPLST